jgi:hypothetical protein
MATGTSRQGRQGYGALPKWERLPIPEQDLSVGIEAERPEGVHCRSHPQRGSETLLPLITAAKGHKTTW